MRKWEKLAASKVKWAAVKNNISSIKRVTRKLKEVPRFSRAKQRQGNAQKSVLHVQSSLFAN